MVPKVFIRISREESFVRVLRELKKSFKRDFLESFIALLLLVLCKVIRDSVPGSPLPPVCVSVSL